MFRFLWLSIKAALSALLVFLALTMLSGISKYGFKGAVLWILCAVAFLALAALPWLISPSQEKDASEHQKRPFFVRPRFHTQEPRSRMEMVIYAALFGPLFLYALFATYWSCVGLFSSYAAPTVTAGTVKSITNKRNSHKLVLETEQGEMTFHPSCGAHSIRPGDRISVGWLDNQRNPFSGRRSAMVIYQDQSIVCATAAATPERWLSAKIFDAIMTIAILAGLAVVTDALLSGLGLKSKLKVLQR